MKVTPLDIRRKEFKRAVRGYADDEVDLFLDEVADELERLTSENAELLERLSRQEEQLSGTQALKDALEKTLVSAQLHADETRAKGRSEAEQLVREAESKAHGIIVDSYAEVRKVEAALLQLKQLQEDFRLKFQSLLQTHLHLLAEAPINLAAVEPVIKEVAPVEQAPFVIPPAVDEVPEYQHVAPPVRSEPVPTAETAPPAAGDVAGQQATPPATPGGAESLPAGSESVVEAAIFKDQALVPPAALLWPETEATADNATEDTAGADHAGFFARADDLAVSMSDAPTIMTDDSVTLLGDDPLQGFFFSTAEDATDDNDSADKKAKNKPRDFEW